MRSETAMLIASAATHLDKMQQQHLHSGPAATAQHRVVPPGLAVLESGYQLEHLLQKDSACEG